MFGRNVPTLATRFGSKCEPISKNIRALAVHVLLGRTEARRRTAIALDFRDFVVFLAGRVFSASIFIDRRTMAHFPPNERRNTGRSQLK
jgi:hypothetical protein